MGGLTSAPFVLRIISSPPSVIERFEDHQAVQEGMSRFVKLSKVTPDKEVKYPRYGETNNDVGKEPVR